LLRIGVAGLLHPAAGYGVRRVSRGPSHHLVGDGYERSVPRAAVHPTKSSPRQQPCRIAAVVASLAFPSVLPVSPARLPGLSKNVANKFVGVLRRVDRLAPSHVDRPPSEEGGREWTPDDRDRRASTRSQGDRSHSGRRPKPSESSEVPFASAEADVKPPSAEARGGASHLSARRPPRWASSRSGVRALRALPPSCGACRSGYRGVGCPASASAAEAVAVDRRSGRGWRVRVSRACRSRFAGLDGGSVPAEAGPCRSGRVFGADRGRHRGTRGTKSPGSRSCLGPRDRLLGLPKQAFAGPAAAG
jgi:hypothetical protein